MPAKALMVQATGSDAGKSLIVAGLCRAWARRGLRVRPFKPQNMSNNAAVTPQGGEIGRAQALQARAAGVAPHVDMNPVLLKPESERGAQVVLAGRAVGRADAKHYARLKAGLLESVLDAFHRLAENVDLVLVEGAGSASEINLRAGDIANMGFAEAAGLPVVLVADIDRGGVIAAIAGTRHVLPPADAARLRGYIVNRFRGDPALFDPAIPALERLAGLPCLGVVPWFEDAGKLPAEDSMALEADRFARGAAARCRVPLSAHRQFRRPRPPGRRDRRPLRAPRRGVARQYRPRRAAWQQEHAGRPRLPAGPGLGYRHPGPSAPGRACAGALRRLPDAGPARVGPGRRRRPAGVERRPRAARHRDGAGGREATVPVRTADGLTGYEIHMGRSSGPGLARPFLHLDGRPEGAVSEDGLVFGTYCHGLFANDGFRERFLARMGAERQRAWETEIDAVLDGLADHLEAHLDLDRLLALAA